MSHEARNRALIAPQSPAGYAVVLDDIEKQLKLGRLKNILPKPSVERLAHQPGSSG